MLMLVGRRRCADGLDHVFDLDAASLFEQQRALDPLALFERALAP